MTDEEKKLLETAVSEAREAKKLIRDFINTYYRTNFPDTMILEKNLSIIGNLTVRDKISLFGGTPTGKLAAVTAPSGGGGAPTDAIDVSARVAINQLIARLQSLNVIP